MKKFRSSSSSGSGGSGGDSSRRRSSSRSSDKSGRGDPLKRPDIAHRAALAKVRAAAMGLVPPGEALEGHDMDSLRRTLRYVQRAGIGQALVREAAVEYDADRLGTLLDELQEALEQSPVPSSEWPAMERVFDADSLALLLGISISSLRRYASGARQTPDDVAARLHFLALVVGDLAGSCFDVHYVEGSSSGETRRLGNPFWEFVSAGGSWVSLSGTGFENLNGPRVPHGSAGELSVAGGGEFIVPNSPPSFSTHDGTVEGALFESTSGIRLASAIEARYIIAEAQGNTAANVAFLNDQRALGGPSALSNPTAEEYAAALREQRAREFFIDGHRLGDLRRYEARYGLDLWPTGAMYGGTVTFGEQKCMPTPVSELF